jgi:hypothetical protein
MPKLALEFIAYDWYDIKRIISGKLAKCWFWKDGYGRCDSIQLTEHHRHWRL